jgi:hypothetical protein
MLPPSLRNEVISNTYGEVIQKIKFLKEQNNSDFLWKILPVLRPVKLDKGDVLYWRGDHAEESNHNHHLLNLTFSLLYRTRNHKVIY